MRTTIAKQYGSDGGEANQLLQSSDSSLMLKKLHQFFPIMLMNRLSLMILLSVDSIIVGWGIGEKAIASVNYLQPFMFVTGAIMALVSNGIATLMSKQLGANDPEGMERKKKAVLYTTLLLSLVLSIVQIPICFIMFRIYDMDSAVYGMACRYAIAIMMVTPFSIMNTVGAFFLSSIGRVKTILQASLLQSAVNVMLDVFFVFALGMSTDGAGFGTLGAGIAYWIYILQHLLRHTEFLKIDRGAKCRREMLDIVKYGVSGLIDQIASAVFGTVLFWFISQRLSDTGIAIHSVCLFAFSFVSSISSSLCSAMQSLTGMLSTIGDAEGMHRLLKQAMTICLFLCGGIALIAEFLPELFFRAYGYQEIPDIGIMVLRVYALHFFLSGINSLLRLYFNNWDDVKYASVQSSLSSIVLPAVFSAIFFLIGAPWTLWLCYALADVICFLLSWTRYLQKYRSRRIHVTPNEFNVITHPDEASKAAEHLEQILLENGISRFLANRVALCVEEIGAYAVPVKANTQVTIQLYACVSEKEAAIIMLDDGQCIAFPESDQENVLAAGNYDMLKRISSECAYDYVLDLNRFTVKLQKEMPPKMRKGHP